MVEFFFQGEKDNDCEPFNGTDIVNLTEQVQNLVGQISELREKLSAKDKKISDYKKALAKTRKKSRDHVSETIKIDV